MGGLVAFLRWGAPLLLVMLVMGAALFGCRAILVSADTSATADYSSDLFNLINQHRALYGLPALRYDARLRAAADYHNRWMWERNCFAHQCPGEPDVVQRILLAGYTATSAGEIIALGFVTPQDAVNGWMGSVGHRGAILTTDWPDLGCAYFRAPGGSVYDAYYTCEFARENRHTLPTNPPPATPLPQPTVIIPPTRQPLPSPTPWWIRPTPTLWRPPTATALPWPAPATPRPLPSATLRPSPQPSPTGRGSEPTPISDLPVGYWMRLTIPLNYATRQAQSLAQYGLCVAYRSAGVSCAWERFSLVVMIDYDVAPVAAAHFAYWSIYEPYKHLGLRVESPRK